MEPRLELISIKNHADLKIDEPQILECILPIKHNILRFPISVSYTECLLQISTNVNQALCNIDDFVL